MAQSNLAASAIKAGAVSRTLDGRSARDVLEETFVEAILDAVADRACSPRGAVARIQPILATSGIAP
jgi:phosphatidylglycerophosphate synthase